MTEQASTATLSRHRALRGQAGPLLTPHRGAAPSAPSPPYNRYRSWEHFLINPPPLHLQGRVHRSQRAAHTEGLSGPGSRGGEMAKSGAPLLACSLPRARATRQGTCPASAKGPGPRVETGLETHRFRLGPTKQMAPSNGRSGADDQQKGPEERYHMMSQVQTQASGILVVKAREKLPLSSTRASPWFRSRFPSSSQLQKQSRGAGAECTELRSYESRTSPYTRSTWTFLSDIMQAKGRRAPPREAERQKWQEGKGAGRGEECWAATSGPHREQHGEQRTQTGTVSSNQ